MTTEIAMTTEVAMTRLGPQPKPNAILRLRGWTSRSSTRCCGKRGWGWPRPSRRTGRSTASALAQGSGAQMRITRAAIQRPGARLTAGTGEVAPGLGRGCGQRSHWRGTKRSLVSSCEPRVLFGKSSCDDINLWFKLVGQCMSMCPSQLIGGPQTLMARAWGPRGPGPASPVAAPAWGSRGAAFRTPGVLGPRATSCLPVLRAAGCCDDATAA
jgi:hypothetical protein